MNHELEHHFPALAGSQYEVTSPAQVDYNCVAWAAGNDSRWWWPDEFNQYYWPPEVPRRTTLEAFVRAFQVLGFEVCNDGSLEIGWEKVAIYTRDDGAPTHAARQLPDGTWTSKLGRLEDIKHVSLDHLSGEAYGQPRAFLRRRRAGQHFSYEEMP